MRSVRSLVRLLAASALVGGMFLSVHGAWAAPVHSPLNCGDPGTTNGDALDNDIVGTNGDDVICGYGGNDKLRGNGGNDDLRGMGGKDQLRGQSGDDFMSGDQGNDRLDGGDGDDQLNGGPGKDFLNSVDGISGNDDNNGGHTGEGDTCFIDSGDTVSNCDSVIAGP